MENELTIYNKSGAIGIGRISNPSYAFDRENILCKMKNEQIFRNSIKTKDNFEFEFLIMFFLKGQTTKFGDTKFTLNELYDFLDITSTNTKTTSKQALAKKILLEKISPFMANANVKRVSKGKTTKIFIPKLYFEPKTDSFVVMHYDEYLKIRKYFAENKILGIRFTDVIKCLLYYRATKRYRVKTIESSSESDEVVSKCPEVLSTYIFVMGNMLNLERHKVSKALSILKELGFIKMLRTKPLYESPNPNKKPMGKLIICDANASNRELYAAKALCEKAIKPDNFISYREQEMALNYETKEVFDKEFENSIKEGDSIWGS